MQIQPTPKSAASLCFLASADLSVSREMRLRISVLHREHPMELSNVEITCLRNELMRYEDQLVDLTKFAVTASSILLGFGLSRSGSDAALIVLVPLIVIAPLLQLMLNRHLNIARVATYLWAFAGDSFRFEERLWKFRKDSVLPRGSFATGTRGLLLIIGFICILLSFVSLKSSDSSMLLPSIAGILWCGFSIIHYKEWQRFQLGGTFDQTLYEAWRKYDG